MTGLPISLAITAVILVSSIGDVASQCPKKWINLPYTGTAKSCSAGSKTNIICLNTAGVIQRWNPAIDITGSSLSTAAWTSMPGTFISAAIGRDGELWAVTPTGAINRWANNKWNVIPGTASKISVFGNQRIAYLSSAGEIYQWNPEYQTMARTQGAPPASGITIGYGGELWCTESSTSTIYRYLGDSTWTMIQSPPAFTQITAGYRSDIFGVDAQGNIFYMAFDELWTHCSGLAESISAGMGIVATVSSGRVYMGI